MHPSQAVDLNKVSASRKAAELNQRGQMYSLATTLMVKHSGLYLDPNDKNAIGIGKVALVTECINLAEEMFRQIEAKEKEHAERQAGESGGTRSALQLP